MSGLRVVYTDKRERRPDGRHIAWAEYHCLQWLDEAENHIVSNGMLPISVHIAPTQMRIDLLFPETSDIIPKRLYTLAVSKSLAPSLMTTPIKVTPADEKARKDEKDRDEKGLLITIQGDISNPAAMQEFLSSSEVRNVMPADAIFLMTPQLHPA